MMNKMAISAISLFFLIISPINSDAKNISPKNVVKSFMLSIIKGNYKDAEKYLYKTSHIDINKYAELVTVNGEVKSFGIHNHNQVPQWNNHQAIVIIAELFLTTKPFKHKDQTVISVTGNTIGISWVGSTDGLICEFGDQKLLERSKEQGVFYILPFYLIKDGKEWKIVIENYR